MMRASQLILLLFLGFVAAGRQQSGPYVYTYGSSWRGFWLISRGYETIGVPPEPQNDFNFATPAGGTVKGTVSGFVFRYDAAGNLTGAHADGTGTRKDAFMRTSAVTLGAEIKLYTPTSGTVSINVRDATGRVVMSTSGFVTPGSFVMRLSPAPAQ